MGCWAASASDMFWVARRHNVTTLLFFQQHHLISLFSPFPSGETSIFAAPSSRARSRS
jgi:hypothetical protein